MSEELVVRYCSPTLAGIKTGSIFSCMFADVDEMRRSVRKLNKVLIRKGLRVIPLRHRANRTLIYVFRPSNLSRDLQDSTACKLLSERGYCCEAPEKCVVHLIRRLNQLRDFPHEIGLFLGYPPEDVYGFIENKGDKCKCVGCWKVYGDEITAQKTFEKYKKCTEVYCAQWLAGRSLERLTVTAQ